MKKTYTTHSDMKDAFPVIRMDYNRKLLSTNLTALPLMAEWNCRKGAPVPTAVLKTYPEINHAFSDHRPSECHVTFGGLRIWFDVIPYPEAGYVGLYGYHIESMVPETPAQTLKMAG